MITIIRRSTRRISPKLLKIPSFRRRFALTVLAFVGATTSIAQLLLWTLGLDDNGFLRLSLLGIIPIGVLIALLHSIPPDSLAFRHPTALASINITVGDLFARSKTTEVVTVNRYFDTDPEWAPPGSLIAQLANRRYGGDLSQLRGLILSRISEISIEKQAIGRILRISTSNTDTLLLALTERYEEKRSSVLVDDIWTALGELWRYARQHNIETLRVPIIGSGFARAQVGQVPLLVLLLTSYVTSAMEMPICSLEIVLWPDSTDVELLELAKLYCETLGFRAVESHTSTVNDDRLNIVVVSSRDENQREQ